MRTIGVIFIVIALVIAALDFLSASSGFAFRPIGAVWASIHRESLLLLQPAIERHLSETLWFEVVQPILELPAAPVAGGIGVVFLFFGWLFSRTRA